MPVSAETLRILIDLGVEGDDLLRVVESIDQTPTKERSANAERQARFRAKRLAKQLEADTVTSNVTNNVTESVTPRVHVEDNLQTKETTGQGRKKTVREEQAEFEAELSPLLDPTRVQALVDVRKKKGGKLNAHSARLLIAKIHECGLSAADAADMMALRNWISIERDWFQRPSQQGRATGPPGEPRTVSELAIHRLQTGRTRDEPSSHANGRMDAGDRAGQVEGARVSQLIALTAKSVGRID